MKLQLSTALATIASCFLIASSQAETPNIVIVLADDLGWGDPQCYQADSKIPTPAIDRLAKEGARFTDAHTPSAVCTPTRYSLLTGRYAWRTRLKSGVLDGFDPPLIAPGEDTLARLLKRAGYQTHCIGKWHLGLQWTDKNGQPVLDRDVSKGFRQGIDIDYGKGFSGGPVDVGFDSWFGISASLDMSPYCWVEGSGVPNHPKIETAEDRDGLFMNQVAGLTTKDFKLENVLPELGKRTAQIIRNSENDETPFFCYVPLTSPHLPVVPTQASNGKSNAGPYGDFVVATDQALATILEALDETDQAEDTLVLFTSDNGGLFHWWDFRADDDGGAAPKTKRGEEIRRFEHQSNADWRGTKADIYEGGHRVPFLIRWPAGLKSGRVIDSIVELTDVYATVAELVGQTADGNSGMDSFSFLPLLRSEQPRATRPFAVHHSLKGTFALRRGDWKLIEGRGSGGFTRPREFPNTKGPEGQLYHLGKDPQETTNRYTEESDHTATLQSLLDRTRETSATIAAK
ncbi:MAG: arylsulfatase [Verrucomicrobiota bacterium]